MTLKHVKKVEYKFEIAARTLCLSVSLKYSREYEWTLGGGPLERNVYQLYTHSCESSKSLEGNRGRDRVR